MQLGQTCAFVGTNADNTFWSGLPEGESQLSHFARLSRHVLPQSESAVVRCFGVAAALLAVEAVLVAFLSRAASSDQLLSESGPIEIGSVVLYLVASAFMLLPAVVGRGRKLSWRGAILLATLSARESDFHNRFTTEGVLRTSYYVRADVPLLERAVVLILLLALAYVSLSFLALYLPKLFAGIRRGSYWALFGACGFAMLALSKGLDAMTWAVRAIGLEWRPSLEIIGLTEETMELTGAAALLLSAAFWSIQQFRNKGQSTTERRQSPARAQDRGPSAR